MSDPVSIFQVLIIILIAIEVLGSYFFVSTIYNFGIPVINDKINIKSFPYLTPKKRIKTEEGIFYLENSNEIYFRARSKIRYSPKSYEMPIKYKAIINPDGTADIEGRVSYTIIGIILLIGLIFSLNFEWIVLPVFIVLAAVSFYFTKRKADLVIYDLEELLSRPEI